jgi:eukaryotic-like serine/threonine-protein kinase
VNEKLSIEMRPLSGGSGDGSNTLPEDLLQEQLLRMQILYAAGFVLWTTNVVMDIYVAPHGDRGPYGFPIEVAGAVLALAGALYSRFGKARHRIKINVGLTLVVPHAFFLALLNSWIEQPVATRPLSGVCVLILFFGMLAPARPGTTLRIGLIAAMMDPLGVWIAHLRGLPVPSPLNTFLLLYPNFICAVLAVTPAHILYRLSQQIREARALGSYQLVERLGEGGMGEVWRARHRLLARSAAVKLIRPHILHGSGDHTAATERFEREAQATASLTSPHTIRLFDFGLSGDGIFYYVMELLDGCDLESLIRRFGPLPPARAAHILRQVCRSLAEAHNKGLIHRDIKPANIYVCRLGLEYDFVKVLDFGLVRHEDRSAAPTLITAGAPILGTPAYMAPEAILGDNTDRRIDVYALGCVAYFLLTGEHVFENANAMQVLIHHVHAQPLPPSRRSPHRIPRELDAVVLGCLQKDPERRPRDAEALMEMLDSCRTSDSWDARAARLWWSTHLPEFNEVAA